jgi:hypothetical protein
MMYRHANVSVHGDAGQVVEQRTGVGVVVSVPLQVQFEQEENNHVTIGGVTGRGRSLICLLTCL